MTVIDCQHQQVDDIAVGAEQTHLPAGEAFEQPLEGSFVAVAALPVDEVSGPTVIVLPEPDLVVLALQEGPYLIAFNYPQLAERWLGAAEINIAADSAQHRWRRGAEQVDHRVEGQTVAIQVDGRA